MARVKLMEYLLVSYLKAFDYYETSQFYLNYSNEDKILMYSIFGGIAFFNSLINNKKYALINIKQLIIEPNSILQLEINISLLLNK